MMSEKTYQIREAFPEEYQEIGDLMVQVYSSLPGFLTIDEAPSYYEKLQNIGDLTQNPAIKLLVAVSNENEIGGAVVYFSDMKHYGSAGKAPQIKHSAGFRFLAVDANSRGHGLGRKLTNYCIERARKEGCIQVVIHSTAAMQVAMDMYQRMGFKRFQEIDFVKGELKVFGFKYEL